MTSCAKPMPRRKKCAATTREAILDAARARFLQDNYDAVGLREVARDAGVDVALVSRYFGGKEELFKEVLRGGEAPKFQPQLSPQELPAYFLSMLANDNDEERQYHREKLVIMLRSASSPTAALVIQQSFRTDVLEPLAASIGGPDSHAKAVLSMALLVGTSFLQTVLPVEPLSCEQRASVERQFVSLMELVLAPGAGESA